MSPLARALLDELLAAVRSDPQLRAELRRELIDTEPPPETAEWFTVAEGASFARCGPATLRRWIRHGELPGFGEGRRLRVRRADLERLLQAPRRRSRALSPEQLADVDDTSHLTRSAACDPERQVRRSRSTR